MSNERITPSAEERAEAYEALHPQLEAQLAGSLRNVDVPLQDAAMVVVAAAARLEPYRAGLLALLDVAHPGDAERRRFIEELRAYAAAALFVEAQATAARRTPPKPAANPRETGKALRAALLAQADALVAAGYLDAAAVAEVREGPQNKTTEIAKDLAALVALFTRHWAEINDKTPVTREQLDQAMWTSAEILEQTVGSAGAAPATPEDKLRAAAFTLLLRAYDENRRGITYLRHPERDADEIAPSVYAGRRGRTPAAPKPEEPIEV